MYGDIIQSYKEKHNMTYVELLSEMYKAFPGKCPTRQAIEGWAKSRHEPSVYLLEALSYSAEGSLKDMLRELLSAVYNHNVLKKMKELKSG